jgi:ribbon-helix-helix CopG family protein
MRRTQIYLSEAQGRALERRSRAVGRTVSSLIREAIDEAYGRRPAVKRMDRVQVAHRTAGAWQDRAESGAQYVRRLRGRRRLSRLYRSDV